MDFIKDFIEQNWDMFLQYLESMGVPEDECESFANDLLKKLR